MQKINFHKQTIIFLIIVLFLVVGFLVFLPWRIGAILDLNKKIAQSTGNLNTVKSSWALKDSYLNTKNNIKIEIEKVRMKIISLEEDTKVYSFISAGSKSFNINIHSLSPEKLQDYALTNSGDFKYLPIQIKAEGGFHSLIGFLNYLQNSKYLFGVKQLSISSKYPLNEINMTICCLIEKK